MIYFCLVPIFIAGMIALRVLDALFDFVCVLFGGCSPDREP